MKLSQPHLDSEIAEKSWQKIGHTFLMQNMVQICTIFAGHIILAVFMKAHHTHHEFVLCGWLMADH